MRKLLVGLVVLASLVGAGASAKDKDVLMQTDKFTGQSTMTMKQMSIGTGADQEHFGGIVSLYLAACSLHDQAKPAALVIYSYASGWQFLGGTEVYLLIDGERFDLGHFDSAKGDVSVAGAAVVTSEIISAPVDLEVFEKIAAAKTVEMKIGPYQTRLNAKGIDRLRSFVAALR